MDSRSNTSKGKEQYNVSKIEEANIEDENDDDGDFEYSENTNKEAAIIEEIKDLSYGVDFVSL